jgi:membrane protease YdiL (CAAX protease family)
MDLTVVWVSLGLGLFLSLAYAAADNAALRWLVSATLLTADAAGLLVGLALPLVGLASMSGYEPSSGGPHLTPVLPALAGVGPLIAALALLGMVMLWRPARRLLGRLVPIDPDSPVHLVALHYVIAVLAVGATLGAVLAGAADNEELLNALTETTAEGGLTSLWLQGAGLVLLAFLGVGFLVRRDLRSSAERLGLEARASGRWWLTIVVLGLLSGYAVDRWWSWLDPAGLEGVTRISDALFGPFIETGLAGVLTVGISAGVGEELVFRGALQPRFGIALTALAFTVLHAQYTISPALLQVFMLAVVLGVARKRAGTTTCMAGHATYNAILMALAVYLPDLGP